MCGWIFKTKGGAHTDIVEENKKRSRKVHPSEVLILPEHLYTGNPHFRLSKSMPTYCLLRPACWQARLPSRQLQNCNAHP